MIKRRIGIISYCFSIMLFVYILLINGWMIYWVSIGGNIIVWHELLPFEFNEVNIQPIILTEIYILLTSIYFIIIGWKKIKETKEVSGNSSHD